MFEYTVRFNGYNYLRLLVPGVLTFGQARFFVLAARGIVNASVESVELIAPYQAA